MRGYQARGADATVEGIGPAGGSGVRYERVQDIVRLAIRLCGTRTGLTLDDIQAEFAISRRTAERMRDAVVAAFGDLEMIDQEDGRRHWRLRTHALRDFLDVTADELAELASAAEHLSRSGMEERAGLLVDLAAKLRAHAAARAARLEPDVEALLEAEGLAMRAGPRPRIAPGLLTTLREAIKASTALKVRYLSRSSGQLSRQSIEPYGLLYGNQAFLVGCTDWSDEPHLWRLSNIKEAQLGERSFERDPSFNLARFAQRAFGTFQEAPIKVVLRFAPEASRDAADYLFHPSQQLTTNDDGSLTVSFEAGGRDEMCWHLFTWGDRVTIERPASLRRRLVEMCTRIGTHHQHGLGSNPASPRAKARAATSHASRGARP